MWLYLSSCVTEPTLLMQKIIVIIYALPSVLFKTLTMHKFNFRASSSLILKKCSQLPTHVNANYYFSNYCSKLFRNWISIDASLSLLLSFIAFSMISPKLSLQGILVENCIKCCQDGALCNEQFTRKCDFVPVECGGCKAEGKLVLLLLLTLFLCLF